MEVIVSEELIAKTIKRRRDFHKFAEVAWTEFRTAAIVAQTLSSLGYSVAVGEEVIDPQAMMGVPVVAELQAHLERAIGQGADAVWAEKMKGGLTGVVGIMQGAYPGPTVALRFDMDANDAVESENEDHRPYQEGFASVNKGAMHACAHDGHTAIGLAVAEVLASARGELAGTIKLIFQPAEEGVRGAKAMMVKGIVDDVDYFIGMHLGTSLRKIGQVACGAEGFLATTKLDAAFTGIAAHAGAAPEAGKNALLAAACAALNLHAIARHSQGASRVNVGVLNAGTGRNVIPANASLKLETRGVTTAINDYVREEAKRILASAADMYGVKVQIEEVGGAASCVSDAALVDRMRRYAATLPVFSDITSSADIGGSEDCTYFIERVQQKGGQGTYMIIGTELAAGHHDLRFDFNEDVLAVAVRFLSGAAMDLLQSS